MLRVGLTFFCLQETVKNQGPELGIKFTPSRDIWEQFYSLCLAPG